MVSLLLGGLLVLRVGKVREDLDNGLRRIMMNMK